MFHYTCAFPMSDVEFKAMVRIAGTGCDGNLPLVQGLNKVEGVGLNFARAVTTILNISPWVRIGSLSDEQILKVEDIIKDPGKYGIPIWMFNRRFDPKTGKNMHITGADVQMTTRFDIDQQKKIRSWKGIRHSLGLKVRGQRTKTTGRTGKSVGVSRASLERRPEKAEGAERKPEKAEGAERKPEKAEGTK